MISLHLIMEDVWECFTRLCTVANLLANNQPNQTEICRFDNYNTGRLSTKYQKKRSWEGVIFKLYELLNDL